MRLEARLWQTGQNLVGGAATWAQANPTRAAALLVGALVVLIVGYYAFRWFRRPRGESFRRVLAREDEISILLHPNPDPDAMAAAMGVAYLADAADTEYTLQFPGEIRHQENRAFRTILDLELDLVGTAADIESEAVVLVDHNEPRGFQNADQIDPVAVVDHHPGSGTGTAFTDVRPEYGACATIVTEYLESVGFAPFDPDEDRDRADWHIPTDVATGLTYGILADTAHLTKGCTGAEFSAAAFLYAGVDQDLLDRIANPQVDAEVLDVKAKAISERDVEGPYAVSHIGDVSNVDAIPQAADELLMLEGVTAVVVSGVKNGVLHLSGRSRDDRVHMGKALERAVEGIPQSGAGGHARMGGGQVTLEYMQGLGPGSGLTIDEFEERLFRSMGGEELPKAV
jgi:nanoRNase/pAp phosphatase (c-di-AMP/oligoRNAs hydrolase)